MRQEPYLQAEGDEPGAELSFAEREQLRQRLKRVPKSWGYPVYWQQGKAQAWKPLRAALFSLPNGQLRLVRQASDPLGTTLLLNEYEALQAVQHENVVDLHWAKRYDEDLLVATSWRELDHVEPPPHPLPWLLKRMAEAARGVAAIHRAGLVHADLKPDTIRMGESWTLVTDLKCAAPKGKRRKALFTPKFAAPEQVLGEDVGPAADLYALGMTLYTLFIKERFPLVLRGGEKTKGDTTTVTEGEMPILSAATTIERWPTADKHEPAPTNHGPDFLIGVKVRFRSRLAQMLEGVQHAGLVAEILRLVRATTQLEPRDRIQTAEDFEAAIHRLLDQLSARPAARS